MPSLPPQSHPHPLQPQVIHPTPQLPPHSTPVQTTPVTTSYQTVMCPPGYHAASGNDGYHQYNYGQNYYGNSHSQLQSSPMTSLSSTSSPPPTQSTHNYDSTSQHFVPNYGPPYSSDYALDGLINYAHHDYANHHHQQTLPTQPYGWPQYTRYY